MRSRSKDTRPAYVQREKNSSLIIGNVCGFRPDGQSEKESWTPFQSPTSEPREGDQRTWHSTQPLYTSDTPCGTEDSGSRLLTGYSHQPDFYSSWCESVLWKYVLSQEIEQNGHSTLSWSKSQREDIHKTLVHTKNYNSQCIGLWRGYRKKMHLTRQHWNHSGLCSGAKYDTNIYNLFLLLSNSTAEGQISKQWAQFQTCDPFYVNLVKMTVRITWNERRSVCHCWRSWSKTSCPLSMWRGWEVGNSLSTEWYLLNWSVWVPAANQTNLNLI